MKIKKTINTDDQHDGLDKYEEMDNFVERGYNDYLSSWGGQND